MMFLSDDKFVNVFLSLDFLFFHLFANLLIDGSDPSFRLLFQNAQLGVQVQILDIGRIDNC